MKATRLEEILTKAQECGACPTAISWFKSAHGGNVDRESFNPNWIVRAKYHNILPDELIPASSEYIQVTASALAKYIRVTAPDFVKYERIKEPATARLLKAVLEYLKTQTYYYRKEK